MREGDDHQQRVLFVLEDYPSLSQTFVLNQINVFESLGVHVDVLAFREGVLRGSVAYEKVPRARYVKKTQGNRFRKLLDFSANFVRLTVNNPVESVRFTKNIGRVEPRTLYAAISARDRLGNYDRAVVHFGPVACKALLLRDLGVFSAPIDVFFHGYDLSVKRVLAENRRGYRELFRRANTVYGISNHWCRRLEELGCPSHKIKLHHMGIDLGSFPYNPKQFAANKESIVLLAVGRLVEKKGFSVAIRALNALDDRFKLVIIGDGPLLSELKKIAEKLSVAERVEFTGALRHHEVQERLSRGDAFVLPAIEADNGDLDGIPVSLMEAMALGIPCFSTSISGIPELISNEYNGFLAEPHNAQSLAETISRYFSLDAGSVAALLQNARQKVANEFDVRKLTIDLANNL